MCRCVAAGVSCGHKWQCSPLTGVRAGSGHLRISRGLGWCYTHAQPQKPGLAAGTDPEAKGVGGGTNWGSTGGSGM